jgi:flagellar biosynthesis/type III secretory pathway protein FliH
MKYTVNIDAEKRTVTVNYKGSIGVAKCCPTDTFDLTTGVELALERARVAHKNANTKATKPTVMELVLALEKALPKGEMVVVGNGKEMTKAQKAWLRSLVGGCQCRKVDVDAIEQKAYDEGYNDGYADAEMECNEEEEEIYDRGYSDGEASAYERGRAEGYSEGYEDAKDELREWLD